MTLPDIHADQNPEKLLSDIVAYIEEAESLVKSREVMPLAGLDAVVEVLCSRILMLEPDLAKGFKPELEQLVARLDGLQTQMLSLKDEIAGTLKSVDTKRKASKAYSSANKTKPGA